MLLSAHVINPERSVWVPVAREQTQKAPGTQRVGALCVLSAELDTTSQRGHVVPGTLSARDQRL